jgi:hypothetical protein
MDESDLSKLSVDYENQIKQIKDELYRIAWYMRGSIGYDDLMFKISREDKEIMNRIIKDNIETTNKTRMPLV